VKILMALSRQQQQVEMQVQIIMVSFAIGVNSQLRSLKE